jgi:ureidoglycolate lyase
MDQVVFDYLNPKVPAGLRLVDVPLVRASEQSIAGYGEIARTSDHRIEIVPWPLAGWRKLDAGTGIEGGTTEGIFACEWRGNELLGRNEAVGGHYVIGFRERPAWHWPAIACCCGIATTIPTAASSSFRSTASRSSCPSPGRAMI